MRIHKNIHLVGGSATGGLKPSELREICRKGNLVGSEIILGKIRITLVKGKGGDFLIKDVSL